MLAKTSVMQGIFGVSLSDVVVMQSNSKGDSQCKRLQADEVQANSEQKVISKALSALACQFAIIVTIHYALSICRNKSQNSKLFHWITCFF